MRKFVLPLTIILLHFPGTSFTQVQLDWAKKFTGAGIDNAVGIAANPGNVYICGNNNNGLSTANIYAVRYNTSGLQSGAALYNGSRNIADHARAIGTDPMGNVYVAGRINITGTSADIVIIKYNSLLVAQWTVVYNTVENYMEEVASMFIDATGSVYLTGNLRRSNFQYDFLTIKISTAGVVQWASRYNGTAGGTDMADTKDEMESSFPGGLRAWQRFLLKNLQYPERAMQANVMGESVTIFIVNTKGEIEDPRIFRSVEYSIDDATIALIKKSPKWIPATQNGRLVKTYKKQPIVYRFSQ